MDRRSFSDFWRWAGKQMALDQLAKKQIRTVDNATARLNIWDGAVRSGKTVTSIYAWLKYIKEDAPKGDLLMVGKTERTLKRNVLDVIEEIAPTGISIYRWQGECQIFGRRIYCVGANDARAEGKIRGLTVAGAYGDELTLWPEEFFTMLLSRLSVGGARFFGTTNPDGPYHWLKTKYLEREGLDLARFQFSLEDNPYLDPGFVTALKSEYVGLWYRRYILGLWVAAEGAIYDMFDETLHVVEELPAMHKYWSAVDYGTVNPTVFLLFGLGADNVLYVCDEWRWDSAAHMGRQMTDAQYSAAFREWLTVRTEWNFVDPSAASFIAQLYADRAPHLAPADNTLLDGIRRVGTLLGAGRLKIHCKCSGLIKELSGYGWDAKAQQRGEDVPLKGGDHGPDALRYFVNGTRNVWRGWVSGPGG